MKTTLAKVTGLALLAASFAFSGSLAYADTEDAPSIQVLTFDAVGNPGEIVAVLDCDSEDGMGNCPIDIIVAEAPAADTTVADAFDPAVLEAAAEPAADTAEPTIRSVDAIIADVNQTVAIAVTGDTETATEAPARRRTGGDRIGCRAFAPTPVSMLDGKSGDEDFWTSPVMSFGCQPRLTRGFYLEVEPILSAQDRCATLQRRNPFSLAERAEGIRAQQGIGKRTCGAI
jgi:hypothetical protein